MGAASRAASVNYGRLKLGSAHELVVPLGMIPCSYFLLAHEAQIDMDLGDATDKGRIGLQFTPQSSLAGDEIGIGGLQPGRGVGSRLSGCGSGDAAST